MPLFFSPQAMVTALTGDDTGYYNAMLSGMSDGINQYGCDYYQSVITTVGID